MDYIRSIVRFASDILFPIFCIECGAEGEWWCKKCRAQVRLEPRFFCPRCTVNLAPWTSCNLHGGEPSSLIGVVSLAHYNEQAPLGKLVRILKYQYASDIVQLFYDLPLPIIPFSCTVVPIPLHPRRKRERGFNQAELIAKAVCEAGNLPLDTHVVERKMYTRQQAKLNRAERHMNIQNSFRLSEGCRTIPERVMLVDDVITTGATMEACARVLHEAGVKEVWGWAVCWD